MFGIIIFGARPIERNVGSGSFYCPSCRDEAPYSHLKVKQFFTLYFIPLIPLGSGRELVRCAGCGSEFDADILRSGYDEARSAVATWSCRRCRNTNPPEYERCVACNEPKSRADQNRYVPDTTA